MARTMRGMTYTGIVASAMMFTALMLTGCITTAGVEAAGKTSWSDEGARELSKKVLFNNSSLKGDVQVVDLQSALAGDLMRGQAVLRSKDRDTLNLQYQFAWFDANGIEINSGSGSWKPLILYGKESRTVQSVAPDPRAKEFKLKLRESDE